MAGNCKACYVHMINLVRLSVPSHTRRLTIMDTSANLVLEDTVERIYHGSAFAENWHGLYLIRGENVVLLGEIVSVQRKTNLANN
jgi:hypothetical protein